MGAVKYPGVCKAVKFYYTTVSLCYAPLDQNQFSFLDKLGGENTPTCFGISWYYLYAGGVVEDKTSLTEFIEVSDDLFVVASGLRLEVVGVLS